MLTKSEVIASLNEAVKVHLGHIVDTMLLDEHIEGAVHRYVNGLRHCREFHDRALKAIEAEFKAVDTGEILPGAWTIDIGKIE